MRQVIDEHADVKSFYTYKPFGEILEEGHDTVGPVDNSFMFTGQYYDKEIDQYYLRARMYDPYLGRFTSRAFIRCMNICLPDGSSLTFSKQCQAA